MYTLNVYVYKLAHVLYKYMYYEYIIGKFRTFNSFVVSLISVHWQLSSVRFPWAVGVQHPLCTDICWAGSTRGTDDVLYGLYNVHYTCM